jgi:hypothetical protein
MMDPCSIGPFDCSIGCRADDSDVESVSIFSGSHTASRKSVTKANSDNDNDNDNVESPQPPRISTGTTNNNTITDRLQSRIADFSKKGWLSQQEHRKYMAMVQTRTTAGSSAVNGHVLKELEKELDNMEEKFSGGTMMQKQTRRTSLCSPLSMVSSCLPTTTEPEPASASVAVATNEFSMAIVEPHQLEKELSQTELSKLFVEMSFFARLGFVQPPCCLQCTYRESMKQDNPNMHCGRWVVWRRNAKLELHPSQLDGNLVVVKCTVARQLLEGKSVQGGYKWDKELEQLILMEPPAVARVVPTTTAMTTTTTTKLKNFNNNNNKPRTSLLEASKWGGFEIQ